LSLLLKMKQEDPQSTSMASCRDSHASQPSISEWITSSRARQHIYRWRRGHGPGSCIANVQMTLHNDEGPVHRYRCGGVHASCVQARCMTRGLGGETSDLGRARRGLLA